MCRYGGRKHTFCRDMLVLCNDLYIHRHVGVQAPDTHALLVGKHRKTGGDHRHSRVQPGQRPDVVGVWLLYGYNGHSFLVQRPGGYNPAGRVMRTRFRCDNDCLQTDLFPL